MIHVAGIDELDSRTLYRILRLRSQVFVVEQDCAYLDADGRDVEPGAVQVWADPEPRGPTVAATLRLLTDPDGSRRIGRVVTAPSHRHLGLAKALIEHALTLVPTGGCVALDAQVHLEQWYERLGFERSGPEFVEDGIVHVPMRRCGAESRP